DEQRGERHRALHESSFAIGRPAHEAWAVPDANSRSHGRARPGVWRRGDREEVCVARRRQAAATLFDRERAHVDGRGGDVTGPGRNRTGTARRTRRRGRGPGPRWRPGGTRPGWWRRR